MATISMQEIKATAEQWAVLEAGPDHDDYWDVWIEVYGVGRRGRDARLAEKDKRHSERV